MDWSFLFDGLGTTIIEALLGLLGIGAAGYSIHKFFSVKIINQKQSAGDNAIQIQIGEVRNGTQRSDTKSRR